MGPIFMLHTESNHLVPATRAYRATKIWQFGPPNHLVPATRAAEPPSSGDSGPEPPSTGDSGCLPEYGLGVARPGSLNEGMLLGGQVLRIQWFVGSADPVRPSVERARI